MTPPDEPVPIEKYKFKPEFANIIQVVGREYLFGRNLNEKTKSGKEYLENLLGQKINTFVPPGNSISKEGIVALEDNNLKKIPDWITLLRNLKLLYIYDENLEAYEYNRDIKINENTKIIIN